MKKELDHCKPSASDKRSVSDFLVAIQKPKPVKENPLHKTQVKMEHIRATFRPPRQRVRGRRQHAARDGVLAIDPAEPSELFLALRNKSYLCGPVRHIMPLLTRP